jgi:uncharacterized protein YqjF (DUF2071 family)
MRMLRPLFRADWLDVVFLHYEMEPEVLQPLVPFELDLREGMAYVSLVIFTLSGLRTDFFPRVGKALLRPVSNHYFLNVRTYVRAGSPGIYFLAEWLSKRAAVPLGRPFFGLPYYFGRFDCRHNATCGISGKIQNAGGTLCYKADVAEKAQAVPCDCGSLDEFLLERYTAFTKWWNLRRFFRVWHAPWRVTPISATVTSNTLLKQTGDWVSHARLIGAHNSPGAHGVWMGRPQTLSGDL